MISIRSPVDPLFHSRNYFSMGDALSAPGEPRHEQSTESLREHRSDESETSRRRPSNTPGAKRRPSRAGTRSVTTLTAAQLERKRANDREAQRAIRQRTKDHIDQLERRIAELAAGRDSNAKLADALQRVEELQQENSMLRSRLNQFTQSAPFGLDTTANGIGSDGNLMSAGAHSPTADRMAMMHATRASPASTVASAPSVTTQQSAVSQGEHWAAVHARAYSPGSTSNLENPSSAVEVSLPETIQWNVPAAAPPQQVQAQPPPMAAADSNMHSVDPNVQSQMGYYALYPNGRPVQYQTEQAPSMGGYSHATPPTNAPPQQTTPQHPHVMPPTQQHDYQTRRLSTQISPTQGPYSPFHDHQAYMQNTSNENMQVMGTQHNPHLMYSMPAHMKVER